jgi:hypothetical protein
MEHLAMELEEDVRLRAYYMWIDSGCEHGNANAHWLAAENDIMLASMEAAAQVMALDIEIAEPATRRVTKKSKKPRADQTSLAKSNQIDIMGRTVATARRPKPLRTAASCRR